MVARRKQGSRAELRQGAVLPRAESPRVMGLVRSSEGLSEIAVAISDVPAPSSVVREGGPVGLQRVEVHLKDVEKGVVRRGSRLCRWGVEF